MRKASVWYGDALVAGTILCKLKGCGRQLMGMLGRCNVIGQYSKSSTRAHIKNLANERVVLQMVRRFRIELHVTRPHMLDHRQMIEPS
jgi:hypothetical protein